MTHPRSALRLLFAAGAVFMLGAPVQAQSAIVYVSAGGKDANACTFAAPCRLLQRALTVVQSRGVVQVLNSAAYGSVTIDKSVTISGGGNVATGTRIYINSASAVVTLRGLAMDGRGVIATGILIDTAAAVHIEDCEIERYAGDGIVLDGANTELFVADTVSRDNGGDGLRILGDGTTARLTVDNSRFENNGESGLFIWGIQSTITRSVASGNGSHGIRQVGGEMNVTSTTVANNFGQGIFQGGGRMSVSWTTAADNGNGGYFVADSGWMALEYSVGRGNSGAGIGVDPGATASVSNSVMTHNSTGLYNGGGTLLTRQNNTVSGNTINTSGTLTPLGGV